MMHTPNPKRGAWIVVSLVALAVGLFLVGRYATPVDNSDRKATCSYAMLENAEMLSDKSKPWDVLPECENMPKADRLKIQKTFLHFGQWVIEGAYGYETGQAFTEVATEALENQR